MTKKPTYAAPVGAGLVVMSSVAYATYGPWIALMGTYFGPFVQTVLRAALCLLILLPLLIMTKKWRPLRLTRNYRWLYALMVASLFMQVPLYYAIHSIGVSLGVAITYAGIVIGAFIFGRIIVGERFTVLKLLATLLGFAGIVVIFNPFGQHLTLFGFSAALISGLATGATMALYRKTPYNAGQTTAMEWVVTLIFNLVFVILLGEHLPTLQADAEWLYLVMFALMGVVANWLLIAGVKYVEAGVAGILGLTEIVFGVLFGVYFFSERLEAHEIYGIILIILAAAAPYWPVLHSPVRVPRRGKSQSS